LIGFNEVGRLVIVGFLWIPFGSEVAAISIADQDNDLFKFINEGVLFVVNPAVQPCFD